VQERCRNVQEVEAGMTEDVHATTAAVAERPSPWRRLRRTLAECAAYTAGLTLLAVAGLRLVPATAGAEMLAGEPVPAEDVPAIVAAARSCSILTPPRVAAQIMAVSGFGVTGAGRDIAGISEAEWQKWKPAPDSRRSDRAANIVALGRHMCQLAGEVRAGKVQGDLWAAALAADRVGVPEVVEAGGVPQRAGSYVEKTRKYANWYADQDVFRPENTLPATA
jgi:hypothetical protein